MQPSLTSIFTMVMDLKVSLGIITDGLKAYKRIQQRIKRRPLAILVCTTSIRTRARWATRKKSETQAFVLRMLMASQSGMSTLSLGRVMMTSGGCTNRGIAFSWRRRGFFFATTQDLSMVHQVARKPKLLYSCQQVLTLVSGKVRECRDIRSMCPQTFMPNSLQTWLSLLRKKILVLTAESSVSLKEATVIEP